MILIHFIYKNKKFYSIIGVQQLECFMISNQNSRKKNINGDFSVEEDYLTIFLTCRICHKIFKDPLRLHRCGHTFCNLCITKKECPLCNHEYEAKQQDLIASNLVADLIVKCAVHGCPYKGSYEDFLRNHQDKCQLKQYGGLQGWMNSMKETLNRQSKSKDSKSRGESSSKKLIHHVDQSIIEYLNTNNNTQIIDHIQSAKANQNLNIEQDDQLYQIQQKQKQITDLSKSAFYKYIESQKCQNGSNCLNFIQGKCLFWHPKDQLQNTQKQDEKLNIDYCAYKRIMKPQSNPQKDPIIQRSKRCFTNTKHFLKSFFPKKYKRAHLKRKGKNNIIQIQKRNQNVIEI